MKYLFFSIFSVIQACLQVNMVRVKTLRCSNFTSNNLGQNLHTTSGLVPFQLSVVVFVVSSAFEAKNLPENNLILSSEPLICGTIHEGVYRATQINQKAVC